MARLGTEIAFILRSLSSDSARMVRIEQVRSAFARAVRKVWSGNPTAVRLILKHTNAVYVRNDDRPRKGAAKDKPYIVCEVYSDDSTVRAELDTWQQILQLALAEQGVSFEEFRILPSKMGMKERHPFQKLLELDLTQMDALLRQEPAAAEAKGSAPLCDPSDLRRFAQAVGLTFGGSAPSVLAKMNAVSLVPAASDDALGGERRPSSFCCTVFSTEDTFEMLMARYRKKLCDNARLLGLRLRGLRVLPWKGSLDERAFPAAAAPAADDTN